MKKNNRKGFTIVELVIVIAVIGILATVLVPTFSNITTKANNSAALQKARNIYTEYLAHDNVKGQPLTTVYVDGGNSKYFKVEAGKAMSETPVTLPTDGTAYVLVSMTGNTVVIDCSATPAQGKTHSDCATCKGQDTVG